MDLDARKVRQRVVQVELVQVRADRPARLHMQRHLGQRQAQLGADLKARQIDQRHSAVEQHARGRHVLLQVEREVGLRRVRRVAAGPHHHDALGDVGRQQQRAGDVGHAADGHHVKRIALAIGCGGRGARAGDQMRHCVAGQRLGFARQVARAAAEHAVRGVDLKLVEHAQDFVEAAQHALARRAEHRPVRNRIQRPAFALEAVEPRAMLAQQFAVEGRCALRRRACLQRAPHLLAPVLEGERRGVHRQHIEPFGRKQGPGQRELVVDFVGRVGVDHHPRAAARRGQARGVPGGAAGRVGCWVQATHAGIQNDAICSIVARLSSDRPCTCSSVSRPSRTSLPNTNRSCE